MIICTVKIRGLDPVGDKPDPNSTVKKKPNADLTLQKQPGSLTFFLGKK